MASGNVYKAYLILIATLLFLSTLGMPEKQKVEGTHELGYSIALSSSEMFDEQSRSADPIDDNSAWDAVTPLSRHAGALFQHSLQNNPIYGLLTEFYPSKMSPEQVYAFIKPPEHAPWYVQLSKANRTGQVSTWKSANLLYKGSLLYHA